MKHTLLILLLFHPYLALAQWVDVPASLSPKQSLSLKFVASDVFKSSQLYYRIRGTLVFSSVDAAISGANLTFTVPAASVLSPGVEYYLDGLLVDGRHRTDPPLYPQYNPRFIAVLVSTIPLIKRVPVEDKPDRTLLFDLASSIDLRALKIYLDERDITEVVQLGDRRLLYQSLKPLAVGTHRLQLIDKQSGDEHALVFSITASPVTNKAGHYAINGNLSANFGGNASSQTRVVNNAFSANLHVDAEIEKWGYGMNFSGINVQYVRGVDQPFTLSSGYLLTGIHANKQLEFGDLSVQGTPLLASGFARRGAQFTVHNSNNETKVFSVRTNAVEGFASGLSTDRNRQTIGWMHQRSWQRFPVQLQLALLSGRQQQANSVNVNSLLPPAGSDSVGLKVATKIKQVDVDAELAISRFDTDTRVRGAQQQDTAYQYGVGRSFMGLSMHLGVHRYGSQFSSIANPGFSADREGHDIAVSGGRDGVSWSLQSASSNDNVDLDPTRAQVTSDSRAATFALSLPNLPALQLGSQLSIQNSRPLSTSKVALVRNFNQQYNVGLSYSRDKWTLSWASLYGHLQDKLDMARGSKNHSHNLAGSLQWGAYNLSPAYSVTATKGLLRTNLSRLLTLSFSMPVTEKVTLSSQMSRQHTEASDRSSDQMRLNGSMRVAWSVQDLFKRVVPKAMNMQFALSASYSRMNDRINRANQRQDSGVFLTFNLGAPFNFGLKGDL